MTLNHDDSALSIKKYKAVVVLGGSAGALEAFEMFFDNLPRQTGMAFIVIQHLDPRHESLLGQLISHHTSLPVMSATNKLPIEADHIYIAPAHCYLEVANNQFRFSKYTQKRIPNYPIDHCFRSVAAQYAEKAVGVIFSGTGSDGTLGLIAIKEANGLSLVQTPDTTKYDDMPKSAIDKGTVDYVSNSADMAKKIIAYFETGRKYPVENIIDIETKVSTALQQIFISLRDRTGHDFSQYKQKTITRRIEKQMTLNQIDSLDEYVKFIQKNPKEIDSLFKELLIGVTRFFRDPASFKVLEKYALIPLLDKCSPNDILRVWVPGCSTGEEAYSIAMLLTHNIRRLQYSRKIQIFATDIDEAAIATARKGMYPASIATDVPEEYLKIYFDHEKTNYQVKSDIREMIVFANQNIIKDPPFSRIDLISCRNLLIYLGQDLQNKILPTFHYSLKPDGYLFLGSSETVGQKTQLFTITNRRHKLFQPKFNSDVPHFLGLIDMHNPTPSLQNSNKVQESRENNINLSIKEFTERTLLNEYTPACVIINKEAQILYIHGHTGKYLEPASGKINFNLLDMARSGLKIELSHAIQHVVNTKTMIRHQNIRIHTNVGSFTLCLTVKPITEIKNIQGAILVIFEDVPVSSTGEKIESTVTLAQNNQWIVGLEQELCRVKDDLQTTIEELETTNEELKSTNEELQSSNEELQSSNEELETSREEMQSINEEVTTVNLELKNKVVELSRSSDDINNLLACTGIATVFVDGNLLIRRFSPSATQIMKLIRTDIGRPLDHIVNSFAYDNLVSDVEEVLETLVPLNKEIIDKSGNWHVLRIVPYRTSNNMIDGAVITTTNLMKHINIHDQPQKLLMTIEQLPKIFIVTDLLGNIEFANAALRNITGYSTDEIKGKNINMLSSGQHDARFYKQLWDTIKKGEIWKGVIINRSKTGKFFNENAVISAVKNIDGEITHFVHIGDVLDSK